MDFRSHLCVWAGRASHGRLRDGRALLALIARIYLGILTDSFGILHFEVLQRPQYNCKQASLGLPNVSMRNPALVGWWGGCGWSLANLEVPHLEVLCELIF